MPRMCNTYGVVLRHGFLSGMVSTWALKLWRCHTQSQRHFCYTYYRYIFHKSTEIAHFLFEGAKCPISSFVFAKL